MPVVHRLTLPDGQPRQVTLRASLGAQLKAAGFAPRDVTHLALSHYHWDHTANSNAFAAAQWLVRPAERDAMFAERPLGAVRPQLFADLKQARTVLLQEDEHDVFGDGSVIIKAAPGHTPGHQVLFVKLAKTGPVLLSGDLYHYPEERSLDRLPVSELDAQQTAASRKAVEAFLQRTGARLWIQHDLTAHRRLRLSPEFYDCRLRLRPSRLRLANAVSLAPQGVGERQGQHHPRHHGEAEAPPGGHREHAERGGGEQHHAAKAGERLRGQQRRCRADGGHQRGQPRVELDVHAKA